MLGVLTPKRLLPWFCYTYLERLLYVFIELWENSLVIY